MPNTLRRNTLPRFHWIAALVCLSAAFSARVGGADTKGQLPLANLQLPAGFKAEVYATPDKLSNPVAICFDRQGRLYTAEAHRRVTGAWGVTMSRWWSMEDYAGKTLEDRQAMYDRWAHIVPPAKLTRHTDIVRQLVDTDGDGRVDVSNIFADGFNHPLEGNAAGIIERDGDIFLANVPHLWRLRDSNRDGAADSREKLVRGLGVRVGVYGHDLHGLTWGPEGRLYFSIGDRGFHVETKEGKTLSAPTRGAVFRCFPDGGGLELFHIGLRNPQEIAFNNVGDLFTVDNDMGGVDKCRVIQIIEGGDSGWDATYQLTRNFREETARFDHTEPPWFTEKLWELPHEGQPAWVNPPIAHLTSGPSGLSHYPGVGLPMSYNDSFFICDFKGTSTRSGVHRFKLAQEGAGYRMAMTNQFVWNVLPADIEFGYDGRIYLADWINGWGEEGDRRIVRVFHPGFTNDPELAATKRIFTDGFDHRTEEELVGLLRHADRRIRQSSQFELAHRGARSARAFLRVAQDETNQQARLHGLWGLWQLGLGPPLPRAVRNRLADLLQDDAPEIRAQTARVVGELGLSRAARQLIKQLDDPAPRPRYFAAMALGRLKHSAAIPAVAAMLQRNDNQDFNLRHAGVTAFARFPEEEVAALIKDSSAPVQLAFLLSLRQKASPSIGAFLESPHPMLRFEAIRAVHDLPIPDCMPTLAALIDDRQAEGVDLDAKWSEAGDAYLPILADDSVPFPIKHRILNANFRLGEEHNAQRLSLAASLAKHGHAVRLEALRALEKWQNPSPFDRVTWHHRPVRRDREFKLAPVIGTLVNGALLRDLNLAKDANPKESLQRAQVAGRLLGRHDMFEEDMAETWLSSPSIHASIRLAMVEGLQSGGWTKRLGYNKIAETFLKDVDPAAQIQGAILMAEFDADRARKSLTKHLDGKPLKPRQLAIQSLAKMDLPVAMDLLADLFEKRAKTPERPEALDIYLAGKSHPNPETREAAIAFAKAMESVKPLGEFQMTLAGGDPKRGKRIFETHAIQCVRCHRIKGFGGDAGPELTKIGRELDRAGILTALIDPPARIAPGFGTFEFELKNGETASGFVTEEDDAEVKLTNLMGENVLLKKSDIQSRSNPTSAMPTMKGVLSLSEIRDLVEYLAGLK